MIIKYVWCVLPTESTLLTQISRGKEHQSSTVAEHSSVVSCQLQTATGGYLGSAHIAEDGKAYPNSNWFKNLKE